MAERIEITDEDSAHTWLETQDHQTQIWFAARCALRGLPGLGTYGEATSNRFALASARAILISAAAATCKTTQMKGLTSSARTAVPLALDSDDDACFPVYSAFSACSVVFSAEPAIAATASAGFAADAASDFGASATVAAASARTFFSTASFEAAFPDNWQPLWLATSQPDELTKRWETLKQHWAANDADWSFWIEWYEGILNGSPMDWGLIYRIATEVMEEEWEAGQGVVATRIAQIRTAYDVQGLASEVAESAYLAQNSTPGRGHNQPPSLIDEDLPEQPPETIIWVAASTIRDEAGSALPDATRVSKAVGILIAALKASGLWVALTLDKTVSAAASAFGKAFGTAAGAAFLAWMTGNSDLIIRLVEKVLSLL